MAATGAQLFGRPDLMEGIDFAGSVDSSIVHRAMVAAGLEPTPRRIGRFRARYRRNLVRELDPSQGTSLPGVQPLLDALQPHARLAILTGNWRVGAALKLSNYDLWHRFDARSSAFGGDGFHRPELLEVAFRRALRKGRPNHIVVVGDTPADVGCARAPLSDRSVKVTAVAVCTGWSTPEALEACEPDLLLDDLASGIEAIRSLL